MLVLFLLTGVAWGRSVAAPLRLEASAAAMGSAYSLVLYGDNRDRLEAASKDVFAEVRRLDDLLSNYKETSELSRLNREAAVHPVPVSQEFFSLIALCVDYSRQSEGAFDITVGPLMKVWGFFKDSGYLPEKEKLAAAREAVGYGWIQLQQSTRSIHFSRSGVELDPGGIGKGYAVDRAVEILKRDGIETALISAGGSSIYALGAPPGRNAWSVGIQNPRSTAEYAGTVELKNESLSTSGSTEKFFVAEGKTWSHIMDPRTGYPAQGVLSVSVVAPRTIDSEAWAKPYFINGRQWTASHKPRAQRVFFCEDKGNQPCAWLP